jgi:hypothetical protein
LGADGEQALTDFDFFLPSLRFLGRFFRSHSIGLPANVGTKPEALACAKISALVGGLFKA